VTSTMHHRGGGGTGSEPRHVVVVMGPPGAGKGTQARRLSERFDMPHVSTGEILRAIARTDSPLAREIREIQASGELVDDAIMARLVSLRTSEPDCERGYFLDGFPRTLGQAELLETLNGEGHTPIAIAIEVPTEALMLRLTGRRQCPVCGTLYNVFTNPPRVEGVCDLEGSPLTHRSDDTVEAVGVRLFEYEKETAPVLAFYGARGRLVSIDGSGDPDRIFADIVGRLEALL